MSLTETQERIVLAATARGLSVHVDNSPGEFGPSVDLGTTRGTADEAKAVAASRLRSWLTDMLGGLP